MDVSVIIINFNTKELTKKCIDSIYAHTVDIDFEVILVDNASSDGSIDLFQKDDRIIFIASEENLGFGRANNLGAQLATGKCLFFLNSDTILLNNALYYYYSFYKNKSLSCVGVAGGILRDENFNETGSWGRLPSMFNTLLSCLKLRPRFSRLNNSEQSILKEKGYVEVGYITGADMFIVRSVFETIGGFDSNIFMYYEETDLQRRLYQNGYKQYLISGPEIVHLEGKSFRKGANNRKRIIQTKSMFYYFKKHSFLISYCSFRILFALVRIGSLLDKRYSFKERVEYIRLLIL